MNKVSSVEIFEPILIQVMGIGAMVEVMCRGILDAIFVASILRGYQNMWNDRHQGNYMIFLLVEHEGRDGPTSIGTVAGLTIDLNGSTTDTEMVDGAGDGMRRRRH